MPERTFGDELIRFIARSPTPFHVVANMQQSLTAAGFKPLSEADAWQLEPDGRYFLTRNDSSIIAFRLNGADPVASGLRMIGAHTDSPCLRVKPNPKIVKKGLFQLGVEVYGGVLLNPWFDRDLSLAGRIHLQDQYGQVHPYLIDFQQPIALVPSLAIHLDREANNQRAINAQQHLPPLVMIYPSEEMTFEQMMLTQWENQYPGLGPATLLGHELSFYDTQPPARVGLNQDFICGARLDNLLSCYVGMRSLIDHDGPGAGLLICNDHEEVGSASYCGADSPFLHSVLQRITGGSEQLSRCIDGSLLVSVDNAHGIHPNYTDRHDDNHGPAFNAGPVIKINNNQRYASNSETTAWFVKACREADVPYQHFVVRTDMACGSTIGPITASQIGVKTVDVGVPTLGMHSIRETAGGRDPYYLFKALNCFLNSA